MELPHPRTTRNGWGRTLEEGWGCTAGKLCWGTKLAFPPAPHPSWKQNLAWGSSTPGRGLYLCGGVEHILLSEAQAVQEGFELVHVLLAHIGCSCCQRKGEGAGGKWNFRVALLLCEPHSADGGGALCLSPSFPSLYQGKRGFLPSL